MKKYLTGYDEEPVVYKLKRINKYFGFLVLVLYIYISEIAVAVYVYCTNMKYYFGKYFLPFKTNLCN